MEFFFTIGSYSDRNEYLLLEVVEYQGEVLHSYPPYQGEVKKTSSVN